MRTRAPPLSTVVDVNDSKQAARTLVSCLFHVQGTLAPIAWAARRRPQVPCTLMWSPQPLGSGREWTKRGVSRFVAQRASCRAVLGVMFPLVLIHMCNKCKKVTREWARMGLRGKSSPGLTQIATKAWIMFDDLRLLLQTTWRTGAITKNVVDIGQTINADGQLRYSKFIAFLCTKLGGTVCRQFLGVITERTATFIRNTIILEYHHVFAENSKRASDIKVHRFYQSTTNSWSQSTFHVFTGRWS